MEAWLLTQPPVTPLPPYTARVGLKGRLSVNSTTDIDAEEIKWIEAEPDREANNIHQSTRALVGWR